MAQFPKDLLERTAFTFVQGVASAGLTLQMFTDLGWKAWLTVGAGAGVLAVVKGLVAKMIGSPNSASMLPGVGPVPPVR